MLQSCKLAHRRLFSWVFLLGLALCFFRPALKQPTEYKPSNHMCCSVYPLPYVLSHESLFPQLLSLCQLKCLSTFQVIFRYALAIFKYNEEEILRIHDSVEIYQYLRFFTRMIVDGR